MKLEDVKDLDIPKGSIIEVNYESPNTNNERVYFEGVIGKDKSVKDGIDMLLCRLEPDSRIIGRNLGAIKEINIYERKE